mgnify:FL=1
MGASHEGSYKIGSGQLPAWQDITGEWGKELDAEKARKKRLISELEGRAYGDLPSYLTDPITEKYTKLAEKQGSYLAGQFGSSGMGDTGIYKGEALDLQKLLGSEYTRSLLGAEEGYRQDALSTLGQIEPEWNPADPKNIIETGLKIATSKRGK